MLPKYHILLGFIFSSAIFLIFPKVSFFYAGVIFLSSFLIDIDHYIYYILKKRNFNPKKSVKYFFDKKLKMEKIPREERKKYYSGFYFLHGIEPVLVLSLLGTFINKIFFFILFGFSFHLILDFAYLIYKKKRIDKIFIIYDFFKFKKLKEIE
jgi:hypothetical protein